MLFFKDLFFLWTELSNVLGGFLTSLFQSWTVQTSVIGIQAFLILYVFIYNTLNFLLLIIAFFSVRTHLRSHHITDLEMIFHASHLPVISILVPAYNEGKTITASVRALLRLKYPKYEIIITNDGSKDDTLDVLKKAFRLVRKDSEYHPKLRTNRVRGLYEVNFDLPETVSRVLVIDKENGGRSDALNAGINASRGDFVCTVDADSILDEHALLQVIFPVLQDPENVIASGGQVAIANGCEIIDGRVTKIGLPKEQVPMFQVVEYIRSFTGGRTAFARLNGLLILSGAFALLKRDILVTVGGFLTPYMNGCIGVEYCGKEKETVCEDMEIIVRIWRYLYDLGVKKKVCFFPHPICWTEAPNLYKDLGAQRNRWYRGLCEILVMHKSMIFNPRYGRIGLFSLPFQIFFEFLGPLMEFTGYVTVPILWLLGYLGIEFVLFFFLSAMVYGTFVSMLAVLLGLWTEEAPGRRERVASLFRYSGLRGKLKLFIYAIVANFGYRQYILWFQFIGFLGFLKGEKKWDKFERQGFKTSMVST